MKFWGSLVAFMCALLVGNAAYAYTHDLGLTSSDIFFSKASTQLIAGQKVRVYSKITNYGSKDVVAHVVFYRGATEIIGKTQPISVRAGGELDEVFIDWTVPADPFVITVEIVAAEPGDEHVANNVAQ